MSMADAIVSILGAVAFPKMVRIRQVFSRPKLQDAAGVLRDQLQMEEFAGKIRPGMSVAITVGSRGIDNLPILTRELVGFLKGKGARPFLVPAMGSHGGATAEGQRAVLEHLGITPEFVGAPIRSSMEVREIGQTPDGLPVRIDREASLADGIVVMNRVKPHPSFRGPCESGLMKMMTIGLGKQIGASVCHSEGMGRMSYYVQSFGRAVLNQAPILFGIGLVENAYDETSRIQVIPPERIPEDEPVLLRHAFELMPRIMYDEFDVLIVDRIGKDISGNGMDPNITGRVSNPELRGTVGPTLQRVVVLDLTEETNGNANGIGQADFTTQRLFSKTDLDGTYPNALTSNVISNVKMPMMLKNDRLAIAAGIKTCLGHTGKGVRIVRVRDTLSLEYLWVSEALLEHGVPDGQIEVCGSGEELTFDRNGNLLC